MRSKSFRFSMPLKIILWFASLTLAVTAFLLYEYSIIRTAYRERVREESEAWQQYNIEKDKALHQREVEKVKTPHQ